MVSDRSRCASRTCVTNTAFGPPATQIYSPLLDSPAGENGDNNVFTAEFSFIPTTLENQPNLYVSVSPDNGTGWRMDRVDLTRY